MTIRLSRTKYSLHKSQLIVRLQIPLYPRGRCRFNQPHEYCHAYPREVFMVEVFVNSVFESGRGYLSRILFLVVKETWCLSSFVSDLPFGGSLFFWLIWSLSQPVFTFTIVNISSSITHGFIHKVWSVLGGRRLSVLLVCSFVGLLISLSRIRLR